ncbi:hypothetical protein RJ639_009285 [Escallonia herrerae]|uniref:Pentatricopeptide repeat-containing protein n=1 Tax=Escallonia herrerae TaxID=1293975 RepID=A0AA89ATM5_9ASTE|nr:hypothetical protein RJ639_009285 [Escallonia herrerae]
MVDIDDGMVIAVRRCCFGCGCVFKEQPDEAGVVAANDIFIFHAGLVDSGRKYFGSKAQDYGIKPGIEHYTCMIDLLGRAEQIDEAEDLICKADLSDDYALWAALLGVCTTCTNSIVAEGIAMKIMELDPDHYSSYVLLANVYKAVGRWDDAVNIRKLMEGSGVKKKLTGKSWIDINSTLNSSLQINYTGLPGTSFNKQYKLKIPYY